MGLSISHSPANDPHSHPPPRTPPRTLQLPLPPTNPKPIEGNLQQGGVHSHENRDAAQTSSANYDSIQVAFVEEHENEVRSAEDAEEVR